MKSRSETLQDRQTAQQGRASICWGPSLLLSEGCASLSWVVTQLISVAYLLWPGRCELWGFLRGFLRASWCLLLNLMVFVHAVYQGKRRKQLLLQRNRYIEKAALAQSNKGGLCHLCHKVMQMLGSAWPSQDETSHSSSQWQAIFDSKNHISFPAGKGGWPFCCTLKLLKCLYPFQTDSWGDYRNKAEVSGWCLRCQIVNPCLQGLRGERTAKC